MTSVLLKYGQARPPSARQAGTGAAGVFRYVDTSHSILGPQDLVVGRVNQAVPEPTAHYWRDRPS